MKTILFNRLNFLKCTFYTLLQDNEKFRHLHLNGINYFQITNPNNPYKDIRACSSFRNIFHSLLLRNLTFRLISPLLENKVFNLISLNEQIYSRVDPLLLKKYLRKFRHNYKYYFDQNVDSSETLTNKEINSLALESLFLLTGV